ncbi:MAG: thiamine-phosphate kinase [Desulfomonilaceae bacterium]|nr:thiamine-phosphate kinase [Desulfomonilaceae bacterium]
MKLTDIGEFGFIDRISPLGAVRPAGVVKGIGDDCAVIAVDGPEYLLVTTDLFVERVHFLIHWATPEMVGAKALAVNLSDIAACGGRPLDAFISLAIPERVELEWLEAFYQGMAALAREHQVNLLGGDTTGSRSDLVINVAVTGLVGREEVLYRHTARRGDVIALTGPIGASAAGCEVLLNSAQLPERVADVLVQAHLRPRAHVKEGRLLASSRGCTAAIDVSDGLSSDLGHLCKGSGLGARLYEDRLPRTAELTEAAAVMGRDPLVWMLDGGEDYVLLVAVRAAMLDEIMAMMEAHGCALHPIGEFVGEAGITIRRCDGTDLPVAAHGWDHFR